MVCFVALDFHFLMQQTYHMFMNYTHVLNTSLKKTFVELGHVLKCMYKINLKLNPNKYSFEVHEIIFLKAHVMDACGVRLGIGKM